MHISKIKIIKSCARHEIRECMMKKVLLFMTLGVIMASCAPIQYCQMYQTKPISNIQVKENSLVFEDENCIISYNFWKEYGEIGFVFYNKTTDDLYLHLDECFYVANGSAYDYFQNRVFSSSTTVTSSSTLSNLSSVTKTNSNADAYANYYAFGTNAYGNAYGSGSSIKNGYVNYSSNTYVNSASNGVSFAEKCVICIPPHTSKVVSEFNIKNYLFRSCAIYLHPRRKDPYSLNFTKDNTPLTFGNRIAYSIGKSEELIHVNNEFYVSKISNYEINKITKLVSNEVCGKKQLEQVRVFNEYGPDQFYIWYTLPKDSH